MRRAEWKRERGKLNGLMRVEVLSHERAILEDIPKNLHIAFDFITSFERLYAKPTYRRTTQTTRPNDYLYL